MMVRSTASIWYGSGAKEIGYGSGKLSAWRLVSRAPEFVICVSRRSGVNKALELVTRLNQN